MTWKILGGYKSSVDLSRVGLVGDEPSNDQPTRRNCNFPIRVLVAFLAGLGTFNANTLRLNLSVALVAMVNSSAIIVPSNGTSDICPRPNSPLIDTGKTTVIDDKDGPFLWDESTRGVILSCYFWGNVIGQIPGGMLADHFGGKWPFGIGILISAAIALLFPTAAYYDVKLLIALRVISGLSQGMALPAMFSLLAKWAPHDERSRLTGLTYAGVSLGKVVVFPISALLCESEFLGGWPAVFYVFGGFAIIWFVLWAVLIYDKPSADPKVRNEELLHIHDQIHYGPKPKKININWRLMTTSYHFWALLLAYFAQAWGAHTLLTILPSYLKFAMNFNMKASGLVNGLPHILAFFVGLSASWAADGLRNSQKLSPTTVRKLFATIAMLIPMLCLFGVTLVHCNRLGLVMLLTVAVAMANANAGGIFLNEMDLSLKAAGTLKGLTNLSSNMAGVAAPYIAGLLVNNDESISEWNRVFYLASGILFIGFTAFLIFGTAEPQQFTNDTDDGLADSEENSHLDDDDTTPILSSNNNKQRYGA